MDEKMNTVNSSSVEETFSLEDIIAEAQSEAFYEETGFTTETEDSIINNAEYDELSFELSAANEAENLITPENADIVDEENTEAASSGSTDIFPKGYDPKFAYNSMTEYAERLHVGCKRAIRSGYVTLVVLPIILSVLLKMTNSDKIFFLVVWIIFMFVLAAALILIAFIDHEIQKRLDEVHANEKFGSLMGFERTELLNRLHAEHHLHTIWHVHDTPEGEVQK